MTVPIESIKPGTVWRFKSGLREVAFIGHFVGPSQVSGPNPFSFKGARWFGVPFRDGNNGIIELRSFARGAIEQVTASERGSGEGG